MSIILENNIYKPINDKRIYEYKQLENGINVLAISDPDTTTSTAALAVAVGSLDDAPYCGLAHFLEHLLFLGSKKYPDEKLLNNILTKYNGYNNAFTGDFFSCYFISCHISGFEKVLDIFGNLFINPLFKKSLLMKEIDIVDSEHKKNINDDYWRLHNIIKEMARKDNPYYNFDTGSIETLNIPDIRDIVKKFYYSHYLPEKMYLVVMSNESTKKILDISEKIFIKIKINKKYAEINNSNNNDSNIYPFDLPKIVKLVPIENITTIYIIWQIPNRYDLDGEYDIYNFISFLFNNKSNNSLYDYLKKKINMKTLSAGIVRQLQYINLYYIGIELLYNANMNSQIEIILESLYYYINQIKNINKNKNLIQALYEQRKYLNDEFFMNKDNEDPQSFVIDLATKFLTKNVNPYNKQSCEINVKTLLISDNLLKSYSEKVLELIKNIFSYLKFDNSMTIISSKTYENKLPLRSKFYNCEYDFKNSLSDFGISDIKYNKYNIQLPKPNKYICKNFDIINIEKTPKYPILIKEFTSFDLWYYFTLDYKTLYTFLTVRIKIPKIKDSIELYSSFILYINCILDIMIPDLYECNSSNYSVNIYVENISLNIIIVGPINCIGTIIDLCIDKILYCDDKLDNNILDRIKIVVTKNLKNNIYVQPYIMTKSKLLKYINKKSFDTKDLINTINNLNLGDIIKNKNVVFEIKIPKIFIEGNVTKNQAIFYANKFKLLSTYNNDFKEPISYICTRDKSEEIIKYKSENKNEFNSASAIFYKLIELNPSNINEWGLVTVFSSILNSIMFNNFYEHFRLKEQLAYIIKCSSESLIFDDHNIITYRFVIQSEKKDSQYLTNKIDQFVKNQRNKLSNFSKKSFSSIKNALMDDLNASDKTFNENVQRNLNKIFKFFGIMNIEDILSDIYNRFTLSDFVNLYDKYFINPETSFRWIVEIN